MDFLSEISFVQVYYMFNAVCGIISYGIMRHHWYALYKYETGDALTRENISSNLFILKRKEFLPMHLVGGIVFLVASLIMSKKHLGLMYRNPYRTYHVDFINKLFPIIRSGQNV